MSSKAKQFVVGGACMMARSIPSEQARTP
jgi:hypothetical protein